MTYDESHDQRINAWHKVAGHPFFKAAYETDETLLNAMLKALDRVHDAIVIERADLPTVYTEPSKGVPTVRAGEWSFDHHPDDVPTVESAKAYLAAALWFEKNPPKPEIDEAQISALYNAIQEVEEEFGYSVPDLARFLYHKGVRVEASDG